MQANTSNKPEENDAAWRLLSIVNLSRLLAGVVLLIIFKIAGSSSGWGSLHPTMFYATAISVLLVSTLFGLAIRAHSLSPQSIALLGSVTDSLLFVLLIHSSGGVGQGIGAMLLMSLCAAALILSRQMTIFAAAVAFILLLGQHIISDFEELTHVGDYTSVGLFGILLFFATWTVQRLGERYRIAEELALRRGVDIANLSQLNDYVVQRLREGVVVLDGEGKTRLMNLSAANMLNADNSKNRQGLSEISPRLYRQWQAAIKQPYADIHQSITLDGLSRIVPSFIPLGHLRSDGMLMFLEDTSLLQEKVQQSKLAALGRLSASIAHEIRNPLAAISHAQQLLSESDHLENEDRYFTGLIARHVSRVNEIIENVLSLSRASSGTSEEIELREWVVNFVIDYLQIKQLSSNQIKYKLPDDDVIVPFTKSQLHQIIENILDNSIAHSGVDIEDLKIKIAISKHASGRWSIGISDNGQGFKGENIDEIFEPFHSGNSQSSGLGLYISRELASLNRASLTARNNAQGSASFELIFADLDRWKS